MYMSSTVHKETTNRLVPDHGRHKPSGLPTPLYFGLLLIYHILITFQGFDMLDEGFHVTFYQQIFNAPSSVQYSFFYWLSGIIGGTVLNLFPEGGLWGLRAAGAVISIATIGLAYHMLKDFIRRDILQISIFLLALYINTEPKDIHYNTISAFLYFLTCLLLLKGMRGESGLLLFLAGIVSGLNIFTRIPNLVGTGIGLVILYHGYLERIPVKFQIRKLVLFAIGVITSVVLVIWTMQIMGHWELFKGSLGYLANMGSSQSKKDGLDGGYGLIKIFYSPSKQYVISVLSVVVLTPFILIALWAYKRSENADGLKKYLLRAAPFVLLAVMLALIFADKLKLPMLTYFYTGVCLITSAIALLANVGKEIKLIAIMGLFIILVHPLASAPGIMTVVIYSIWLSLPLGIHLILSVVNARFRIQSQTLTSHNVIDFTVSRNALKVIWSVLLIGLIALPLFHLYKYPYFYDYHKRTELVTPIQNTNTRFIYTSPARAEQVNQLLAESKKYIQSGDYVLAHDAIPMFHFLTETKPYLRNPAPMFYSTSIFDAEMDIAQRSLELPVVVSQNIKTYHEGSSWPETIVVGDYFTNERSAGKNEIFDAFLVKNGYKKVWSNTVFNIYLPPNKFPN